MGLEVFNVPEGIDSEKFKAYMEKQLKAFTEHEQEEQAKGQQVKAFETKMQELGFVDMVPKIQENIKAFKNIASGTDGSMREAMENKARRLEFILNQGDINLSNEDLATLKNVNSTKIMKDEKEV